VVTSKSKDFSLKEKKTKIPRYFFSLKKIFSVFS